MEQVTWHDHYKIGVDFIDKEHKQLFSTINKLLTISESEDKSEWACKEGVKYLKNHTIQHFEHEEEYMRSIQYSEYEIHKRLHDNFRKSTLPALEKEMNEMHFSTESIRHFLGVCIGWVVAHTQTEDLAITGKVTSKWTNIPHEKEKDALEQVIVQLIGDIFQRDAKLISEQYAGENFGKMVCCNFSYTGSQKEKWDITLVFEEQLILHIAGRIMDMQYPKVDDMAVNIIRYMSRQFMERIRGSFPSLDLFELKKESLMTHEQLINSFERIHPPCSLLFDTGKGYFAFCASTRDSMRGKILPSINAENAIDSIKEYLSREEIPKRKILLVDDSDFMRARIVKLLSEDYEMIEANSSVSAIKKITINRPDLILLDYEMPVFDGRQALEMIRSEKDTANIPVIFLTGRGDMESVKKVMQLKPEGYMLKTLSDADIKKTIDMFFGLRA